MSIFCFYRMMLS